MDNNHNITRRWVEFRCEPPGTRTGAYASINEEGRIAINRNVWNELGSPKAVSLLYDEANRAIGIRRASSATPNTFPVVPVTREQKRFWIRAKDFITHARVHIPHCTRFLDPHLEDNTLILDLNHTTRVLGPRHR